MSTSRVFTAGQVLTAAQMNDLPQGILGKVTATTDFGPASAATELDVITAPAVTIAGTTRRLRISFHARNMQSSVASDVFVIRIKEGATILQEAHFLSAVATAAESMATDFSAIVDSPSAASHTYKVTATRAIGTGNLTISGTASAPITLTVEDVGQV